MINQVISPKGLVLYIHFNQARQSIDALRILIGHPIFLWFSFLVRQVCSVLMLLGIAVVYMYLCVSSSKQARDSVMKVNRNQASDRNEREKLKDSKDI
jgi:hypothetical protein